MAKCSSVAVTSGSSVEERCGHWAEAMDKLDEAVAGLVRDGDPLDAAIAGVRLAQLYGEQRRLARLPALTRTLAPALRRPEISLRARTLVAALLRLAANDTGHLPGLFEEPAASLERARYNPDLPLPARDGARAALMWDDLNRARAPPGLLPRRLPSIESPHPRLHRR